jgi:hypothetical protein
LLAVSQIGKDLPQESGHSADTSNESVIAIHQPV